MEQGRIGGAQVGANLYSVVKKEFSNKVTFDHNPEGDSHVDSCFPGILGNIKCKR